MFPSPYGERVKESSLAEVGYYPKEKFPSPYGERVKERIFFFWSNPALAKRFPSPYGERVKERIRLSGKFFSFFPVSIPLRGKGKGKFRGVATTSQKRSFHPLTGKG